ncbi:uncharacterized protein LOC133531847 [Cydia pomonella]|uniref:uncharacterized protein LOC133531847 n=1 Tax=Cydia pomonella TaxID=82600 RepID=UPI002ADE5F52|nr:uncharacterized protein LOC133531847 [Cydia pomonella]
MLHKMCVDPQKHPAGAAPAPAPSPPRLQVPVPPGAAGAAFVRRVVRGVRRAAKQHGFATSAAIKEVARRLGTTEDRIFQTWWGVRKLAMYKLRQAVARGDAAGGGGRLHAVDWAVVDLVLLYRGEMVNESLYQNYEQLSALLGTFHLVQRFELEGNKRRVPPHDWVNAARWYSRNARGYTKNRVQMSAVALQKRWFELKQDTRRRFHAQMGGKPGLVPLPIHQAIARRYGYVVTRSAHQVWRHLVTSGQVAPPTSERGPAPGEDPVPRHVGDDDSSDSDTARAEDDDDVAIVEKTLETIDLSEDIREEDKTKEVVTTKEKAAVSSTREGLGDETGEKYKVMIVDNVTANTSDKPTVRLKKLKTSKHGNKPDKNHTASSKKKKISKQFDKTIDINKEIVDLDAPSPKTDVLEALQEFDVNNFETTIFFDSDDEDFTPNVDKTAEVPNDGNEDSVPSVNDNDNESQTNNKAEKRHQRESSDSSNGNLVIDDNVHSENESSNSDAEDTNRFHEYNPNVYSNKKRKVNGGVTSKTKRSKVTVSDLMKEVTGETNDVEENEESSSDDGSRSSDSSGGKETELGEEEGSIDPKLLMYAVVLLERIDGCLLHPTSRESSKLPSPSPTREPSSPESLPIKTEHLSPSRSPIRNTSSPVPPTPERVSTPILSRITPPPPLGSPPLLSRITPSPSLGPSPLFTRNSPPPLTLFKTDPHPGSLFNFFVSTLPPKFVFNKNNIPLLRMCKFCSVVLQRIDLTDKGKMGNRVAKKVELPDIEEVRRNNRSMLTAQVAPRRARRTSGPTPSPSSGSDSDWMPDADEYLVVRRTLRRTTESGRDSRTQRLNTDESSSDSRATPRRTTDESGSDEGSRRGSQRRTADGSEFGVWRARQRVKEAELQRMLDNLAGINGEKDCDHIKSTSMRGPAAAVLSSNCSRCAARVLSAPPVSGREARLQRQLLRRAARMARVPVVSLMTVVSAVP